MPRARNIEIGSRLRDSRINARLSPVEVAQEVEVSPKTVYSWESGARDPGAIRLADLCLLYGVSADYILFGTPMVPADLRDLFARMGRGDAGPAAAG